MIRNQVYILSDAIRVGKTTALGVWAKKTNGVVGFLSPDVNGRRMFKNIETGELIAMEAEQDDLIIGKYNFSSGSFKHVEAQILKDWKAATAKFIVLDEIGPLEVKKNQGFHELLLHLQKNFSTGRSQLFFVVRDYCLDDFLTKYDFGNPRVMSLQKFKRDFNL